MYPTSDDLMKHIHEHHSNSVWYCTKCYCENTSQPLALKDEQSWLAHMHHKHDCTPKVAEALASSCQGKMPEAAECPLCAHWTERNLADDEDHILWHIHSFALNCLPWDEKDDWESAKGPDTINSQDRIDDANDEEWSPPVSPNGSDSIPYSTLPKLKVDPPRYGPSVCRFLLTMRMF